MEPVPTAPHAAATPDQPAQEPRHRRAYWLARIRAAQTRQEQVALMLALLDMTGLT